MKRANHAAQPEVSETGRDQQEILEKKGKINEILEKAGFSKNDLSVAKEVLDSRMESIADKGFEQEEAITAEVGEIKSLMDDWDGKVKGVTAILENDKRLAPYSADDLSAMLEMEKATVLSNALESGDLNDAIENGLVDVAEKQRALKAEQDETDLWSSESEEKDTEVAENLAKKTKAEMAAMDTGDEETFEIDADQSDAEALAASKQYKGVKEENKNDDFGDEQGQDANTPAGPAYRQTSKAAKSGVLGRIAGFFRR